MENQIAPALSADDWAVVEKYEVCYLRAEAGPRTWWDGGDGPQAVMALANARLADDSPYKITREDLEIARAVAGDPFDSLEHYENRDKWAGFVAKLTALLPPDSA